MSTSLSAWLFDVDIMQLLLILYSCSILQSVVTRTIVRGIKRLGPTHRCTTWRVVYLDSPSIAVSRIGSLVVVFQIKCECVIVSFFSEINDNQAEYMSIFMGHIFAIHSNIGLPFYGRSFSGSGLTKFGQANDGSADTITWIDDEGSPQCKCAD